MRTAATRPGPTAGRGVEAKDRLLKDAWSQIGKDEEGVLKAVTKVIETVPAPADVIDSALAFTARMLKAQREALVPLLEGVMPKVPTGGSLPSAADAVASAYDLAERVVESQRRALRGLVETVTPPLARHGEKAAAASAPRRAPAPRTPSRPTSSGATKPATRTRRVPKKAS